MKKPLFILTLAAAVSPVLDAKVYSCGANCYSDKAKGSKGYANLGKQIGSYTSIKSQPELDTVAENKVVPQSKLQHAHSTHRARQTARPMAVKRTSPSVPAAPAVAVARAKTNPAKISGRRTILEQELNNERNALVAAQRALADGRVVAGGKSDAAHQSRVRQLESAVLDRQQNIQALQRELGRM